MAVVLFGHQVLVKRLLDPLDKGAANLDQLWQQPLGGFESYLDAVERSLNIAEYELGSDDQARILVITDGQLSLDPKSKKVKSQIDKLASRVADGQISVSFIIVGPEDSTGAAKIADAGTGSVVRVRNLSEAEQAYRKLGQSLAGKLEVSFVSEGGSAGDRHSLNLAVRGSDPKAQGEFTVPSDQVVDPARLALTVNLSEGNSIERTLVRLDGNEARWVLAGPTKLHFVPGVYSASLVGAHYFDRWLDYYDANRNEEAASDKIGHNSLPGLPFEDMLSANSHNRLTVTSLGETYGRIAFPQLVIKRSQFRPFEEASKTITQRMTLDMPRSGPWLRGGGQMETFVAGLTSASAEHSLRQSPQTTSSMAPKKVDDLESAVFDPMLDSRMLLSDASSQSAWLYDPKTGDVRVYDTSTGIALKGDVEEIAREFWNLDNLLAGIANYGLPIVNGYGIVPDANLLAGFIALLRANMKAWCYSTVMMGFVAEAIGNPEDSLLMKDTAAAYAKAEQLCDAEGGVGGALQRGFVSAGEEYVKGWFGDRTADFINKAGGAFVRPGGRNSGSGIRQAANDAWNSGAGGSVRSYLGGKGWEAGSTIAGAGGSYIGEAAAGAYNSNAVQGAIEHAGPSVGFASETLGAAAEITQNAIDVVRNALPSPVPMTGIFHKALGEAINAELRN